VFFTSVPFLTYSPKNICYVQAILAWGTSTKNGNAGAGVAFTGCVKSKLKLMDGGLAEDIRCGRRWETT